MKYELSTENKKIKKGFTLSEILITLGIIGVVAAITMPTIIKQYQKQAAVNKLKKVYSELQQAIMLSEAYNGNWKEWDYSLVGSDFFEKYITPYMKIIAVRDVKTMKDVRRLSGSKELGAYVGIITNATKAFTTAGGVDIMPKLATDSNYGTGTEYVDFIVDINGQTKPNRLGHDVFIMSFTKNNKLRFYDETRTGECNPENATSIRDMYRYGSGCNPKTRACYKEDLGTGIFCGALLLHDGWDTKDYPW